MATPARPAPRRLLIVPSYLRGYGGVERWVESLASLASLALLDGEPADRAEPASPPGEPSPRWTVTVAPARALDPDGPLAAALAGRASVVTAEDAWRRTPSGRVWAGAALAKAVVTEHHQPDARRRATLAGDRARPYLDRYWDGDGAALIAEHDLVHVVGSHPYGARAIAAAHRAGRPVVYNETSQVTPHSAGDAYHDPFRDALPGVDVVLAHSSRQADDLRAAYGFAGRVEIVDQWVDGDAERQLLDLPPPLASGRPLVVGALARLAPEKGLDRLVDAVAGARRAGADVELVLGGDGPARSDLEARAVRAGIQDRVRFAGFVDPADRADFYGGIDVFALTSTNEGGPLTGAEAMAAGRAIVTTPVGSMPDRLVDGTSAWFVPAVPPGGTDATGDPLVGHLVTLAAAPERRAELGVAARAAYRARNTSARQAGRLLTVWDELVSAG